jgi:hypothetical protein
MKEISLITRLAVVFFIVAATVLLALYIFDAVSMDAVQESLTKIGFLSVLVIVASGLIVAITGGSDKK